VCGEQDGNWSSQQKFSGGGNINQGPVATRLKTPCENIPFLINYTQRQ
jgi:hypothetical protein